MFLDFGGRIKDLLDVYLDRIDFSEKEKRKIAAGRCLKRVSISRDLTPPAKFLISSVCINQISILHQQRWTIRDLTSSNSKAEVAAGSLMTKDILRPRSTE